MIKKNDLLFLAILIFIFFFFCFFFIYLIDRYSGLIVLKKSILYITIIVESLIFSYLSTIYLKNFYLYKKRIFGSIIKFKILNYIILNLIITFMFFTSFNYFYNFNYERRKNIYTINSRLDSINLVYYDYLAKLNQNIKSILNKIEEKKIMDKYIINENKTIKDNKIEIDKILTENQNRILSKQDLEILDNIVFIKKNDLNILNKINKDVEKNIFNKLKNTDFNKENFFIIDYESFYYYVVIYNNYFLIYYPKEQEIFKINNYLYDINIYLKKEYNNILYSPVVQLLLYISFFIPFIFIQIFITISYVERFNKPLTLLLKGFENLTYDEYKLIKTRKSKDEIYYLIESFNNMQKELLKQKTFAHLKTQYDYYKKITNKIAHEIKNPLTPINLSLQLILKKYPYNDEYKAYLEEKVNLAIEHLNQIKFISEKLYFIDSLTEHETTEEINLYDYLNEIKEKWESESIKIYLKNFIDNKEKIFLKINIQNLNSVFTNLIINSVESKKKDLIIEMIIRKNEKNEVIVDYIDNGPGIPKEIKNIVFEPFYTTKSGGSGLGLYIIKSILNNYNYNIEILYDREKGVHFVINFGRLL